MSPNRSYLRHLAAVFFLALLGAGTSASGQINGLWINRTGLTPSWNDGANWFGSLVPLTVGDIASITADISVNQTIDLGGTITIGTLNLGDISGGNIYTLANGPLKFDSSLWGSNITSARAQLNKVAGVAPPATPALPVAGTLDTIQTDVELVSDLMIYNRVAFAITGSVLGGGALIKSGSGNLILRGSNSYIGDTIINTTGGVVFLDAASGLSITSTNVRIGNSNGDGSAQTRVQLARNEQINDAALIRFEGGGGREGFLQLNGFSETVQGISDVTAGGVVENAHASNASTLTLQMAGGQSYDYNGFLRNGSTGTLAVVKNGTGILSLAGGQILFTGGMTVNAGTLKLTDIRADNNNQNRFGSAINLVSGSTGLQLAANNPWRLSPVVSGAGSLSVSGPSVVTLTGASTFTGSTSVSNGTLALSGPNGSLANTGGPGIVLSGGGTLSLLNRANGSLAGGSTSNNSAIVNVASTAGISPGMNISGPNVPGGATVVSVTSGTQFVMSANATAAASGQTFSVSNGNNTNRVNDAAAITSQGGSIRFEQSGGASTTYSETLGALTLASGHSVISAGKVGLEADASGSSLNFSGFTRNAGSSINFTNIGGAALGTGTANQVTVTGGIPNINGIIGGWATVGNEWAAYGANGVTALQAAGYSPIIGGNTNSWGNGATSITVTDATGLVVGMQVTGSAGIQAGTTISSISGTNIGLSLPANAAGNNPVFGTYGATQNLKLSTVTASGTNTTINFWAPTGTTVNSLHMQATGARTFNLNGRELFIGTGGIVLSGANMSLGGTTAGTAGAVKSTSGELIVNIPEASNRTLTVTAQFGENAPTTLVKTGSGRLLLQPLAGNNTYSGGTIVNGGSIEIGTLAHLGSNNSSQFLTLDGGAIELVNLANITIGGSRQINIGPSGGRIEMDSTVVGVNLVPETLIVDVPIVGPGKLTMGGGDATGGLLTINGNLGVAGGLEVITGTLRLNSGANTFSGGVTVSGGEMVVPSTANIPANQALVVNGGIFRFLDGGTITVSSLSGSGSQGRIQSRTTDPDPPADIPANLIVNQSINTTYVGLLEDSFLNPGEKSTLTLTKQGNGVLNLTSADSTYRGMTIVEGGILGVTAMTTFGTPSSIGLGTDILFVIASNSAPRLVINPGAGLNYIGSLPSVTDRAFTIGTPSADLSKSAAIYANGTNVGATIEFQEFLGELVEFGTSGGTTLTLGGRNAGNNIFGLMLADNGADYLSLVKTGTGTWLLNNANGSNTYSGATTVYDGRLAVIADGAFGTKGGNGPPVQVLGGVLDLRNVAYTAAGSNVEDMVLSGGRLETTTGTSSWAGGVDLLVNSGIGVARSAQLTLLGSIGGGGGLTKDNFGTLVLAGNNTYTGATTFQDGNLVLDYSTNSGSKLADAAALVFGGGRTGGTLVLKNTGGGSPTEVVGSTTLNRGEHNIVLDPSTSVGQVTINLGNITRAAGALLDVQAGGIARTTTANNASGILGSWATVGHLSWARKDATGTANGFIEPLAAFASTWALNNNTDVTSAFATSFTPAANAETNTLRFNQAGTPVTVTLNGNNRLQSGGILVTQNVNTVDRITGPGTLTAGGTSGNELVIQQFSSSAFVVDAEIRNNGGTSISLQKLGSGVLALAGANTYTGVTTVAGGILCVTDLSTTAPTSSTPVPNNPAGHVGQSSSLPANLVLAGGSLDYAGSTATTYRGFTVREFGAFMVDDEDMTLTIAGSNFGSGTPTANVGNIVGESGTAVWDKSGSGTLRLLRGEVSGGASSIQELNVADGKLVLEYGYDTTPSTPGTPTPPNATDRIFNSSANLRVSGGTLELVGDDYVFNNAQSIQTFGGSLFIGPGASEVRVTSQTGLNPFVEQITTLNLGNSTNPQPIIRDIGGTVLLVENPNGGRADMKIFTVAEDYGIVLPWATYWNTNELNQPGVNNFATIQANDNDVISADDASLHKTKSNPADWLNDGIENISEEGLAPFGGANVSPGSKIRTLRFFNDNAAGTITITSGETLTLTGGAILMGYHIRNQQKTITGGTLTSEYLSGIGQAEIILHNYNPAIAFNLNSVIADPTGLSSPAALNLVHTGTGTTSLFEANTYTGTTYLTGGVLRLENANALPGGVGTAGGTSALLIDGGVIGLTAASGDFTRGLGSGIHQFQWASSGGFAAYGVDRSVNIGGAAAQVRWGQGGFMPDGDTLVLGNQDADKTITFANPIDLGVKDRLVRVENGAAAEDGVLSGALSSFGSLTKNGEGTLRLSATNTHAGGTTLAEGTLVGAAATSFGTGPINTGTTLNTEPMDALRLIIEPGTVTNAMNFGNVNSQGITTLDPTGALTLNGAVTVNKDVFVGPEAGQTLTVNGAVGGTGGLRVVDGGTVVLNSANTFGSGQGGAGIAVNGSTIIRSGTVQIGAATSLGDGTKAVELGDDMVAAISADAATTGRSLIYSQGAFDPDGNGFPGSQNGIGAFYDISNQLDGITFTAGDANTDPSLAKKILVKDQYDNPEQNGVYFIYSLNAGAGTMTLARLDDGTFPLDPIRNDYGQGITVTGGTVNGGQQFFLARQVDAADINVDGWYWKTEHDFTPNVALVVPQAIAGQIANPLDINDTNGSGTTTIGGTASYIKGTTEFSGPMTLQSQIAGGGAGVELRDVFLNSNDCANIIFSGIISESDGANDVLGLIKTGTGDITLSGANTYHGVTEAREGIIKLNHASALPATSPLLISGGIVGLNSNSGGITRTLGIGAGQVSWLNTASGGFASYGSTQSVSLGASVTWGAANFVATGQRLVLGADDADGRVNFTSGIDLGSTARQVNVLNGPATVEGEISGALTSTAGGGFVKVGQGALLLSGTNTSHVAGTTLAQGTLQGSKASSFGTADIQVGGTDTQLRDGLKLEFVGDTAAASTVTFANNIIVGTQNSQGTTSIDATDGLAAGAANPDVVLAGAITLNRNVFIGSDAGADLRIAGNVTGAGGITVVDGGALSLNPAVNNTFGTGGGAAGAAINGGTVIRQGTIELLNSANPLGATTVELGDARSIVTPVDRATTMSISDCGALFSAGTFTNVHTTLDGFTYNGSHLNTRILVKDELTNPERNGVYQISAVSGDNMTLVRVGDFDASGEMLYGSTVNVANGTSATKDFFLTGGVTAVNADDLLWREGSANPNVALLAGATSTPALGFTMTVSNVIDVNPTIGTGTATIGGAASFSQGQAAFSGNITLQGQAGGAETQSLLLASHTSTNNGITFSGVISDNDADPLDSLILRKTGSGVVTLSNASGNTFIGGAQVEQGVLLVNNTTGSGTGSGPVTVSNAGTVLGGTGSVAGLTTINTGAILQPGGANANGDNTFDSVVESLAFTGGLTLGAGSTAVFQLTGNGINDRVDVSGATLTVDPAAVLQVVLGYNPAIGHTFNLIDWGSLSFVGPNLATQLQLPGLDPGESWDTSAFHGSGVLTVSGIPEPSRMVLVLGGLLAGLMRRKRHS